MKQFIRYLYEYDDGKRVRNVGFTKVERQRERCVIHIHGKGMDFGGEGKAEVYVFYVRDGGCIGIFQGMIEGSSPLIHYILKFGAEDAGGERNFDEIVGIILRSGGKTYAAVWSDAPVNVEKMRTWEETEGAESEPLQEEREDVEDEPLQGVQESAENEPLLEEREGVENEPHQEETPHRETLVEHVEKIVAEEIGTAEQYISPSTRTYEKIQRRDISRLPRREWKLANNSFLLHGFYNYHHLLYIEEEGNCWIGVPGIYHEKERAAARAFGFPQFHRITDADIELSKEEKNTYDDFGYWCRQVDLQ